MLPLRSATGGVLVLALLAALAGCGTTRPVQNGDDTDAALDPVAGRTPEGGGLLKTGAFLLGPGQGRDLLRSQGDGEGGFFGGD